MKYIANPVEVDAYRIVAIGLLDSNNDRLLILDTEAQVKATPEMRARYEPRINDYWVIQSDGYVYLNPKAVFERKYFPKHEKGTVTVESDGSVHGDPDTIAFFQRNRKHASSISADLGIREIDHAEHLKAESERI